MNSVLMTRASRRAVLVGVLGLAACQQVTAGASAGSQVAAKVQLVVDAVSGSLGLLGLGGSTSQTIRQLLGQLSAAAGQIAAAPDGVTLSSLTQAAEGMINNLLAQLHLSPTASQLVRAVEAMAPVILQLAGITLPLAHRAAMDPAAAETVLRRAAAGRLG